jgi:hypothetical protein
LFFPRIKGWREGEKETGRERERMRDRGKSQLGNVEYFPLLLQDEQF